MNLIERAHRALAGVTLNEGTDDWCKLSIANEHEVLTPLIKAGVLGPSEAEQAVIDAAQDVLDTKPGGMWHKEALRQLRVAMSALAASAPDEADQPVPDSSQPGGMT